MFLYSRILEVQTHFVITALKFLWILHQLIQTGKNMLARATGSICQPKKKQKKKRIYLCIKNSPPVKYYHFAENGALL